MCVIFSAQSSWEVAQGSQTSSDVCHVSAETSWEVAQSSYVVYHILSSEQLGSSSK